MIVRRRDVADDPALVPVGLPLPPSAGKRRIALAISPAGILQCSPLPSLLEVASIADRGWRKTISTLLGLGVRSGVNPCAFGSLLWQHQTGLTYLTPQSDLDILWNLPADFDVLPLLGNIAKIQRDAPMRIDGEVAFCDGTAVNWRELWNAHRTTDRPTVLVKTIEGVRLLPITSLPGVGLHA